MKIRYLKSCIKRFENTFILKVIDAKYYHNLHFHYLSLKYNISSNRIAAIKWKYAVKVGKGRREKRQHASC